MGKITSFSVFPSPSEMKKHSAKHGALSNKKLTLIEMIEM